MTYTEYETSEELRELATRLESQLAMEREHRQLLQATLDGFQRMSVAEGVDQAFESWTAMAHNVLEFEHAMILTHQQDTSTGENHWQVKLATNEDMLLMTWSHDPWFHRASRSPHPLLCFDASCIPSWTPLQTSEAKSIKSLRSLLVMPLQWGHDQALMVCMHSRIAAFHHEQMRVYSQVNLLASQVFASLMHRNARIGRDMAKRADQAKSEFLASMSHELRTPLNIIIGYGELILEESQELDYLQHDMPTDMSKLLGSAHHLLDIVGNVLDLSRIEQDKITTSHEPINLQNLIQAMTQSMAPLTMLNHNTFEVVTQSKLPSHWEGDETRVRQILLNLLSNASKFTSNGHITLRIKYKNHTLSFMVEDTGPGIAPEQMPRLFDLFERLDNGFAPQEGAGLGLSISRKLAQLMGGDVHAHSQLGVGSCFEFMLPIQP